MTRYFVENTALFLPFGTLTAVLVRFLLSSFQYTVYLVIRPFLVLGSLHVMIAASGEAVTTLTSAGGPGTVGRMVLRCVRNEEEGERV